jgi:hypothetical protein
MVPTVENPCLNLFARVLFLLDEAVKTPEIDFPIDNLLKLIAPLCAHTQARICSQYIAFGRALRNQKLLGSRQTVTTLNRRFTRLRFTIDWAETEAFDAMFRGVN